ncbi:hypothetical protein [Burkholderia sp. Ac-20379]|uniref:hypothetical protein n=1 Tax=Burkholderia sp. Ac-20379 TaxID=2703900 RepID=UPI00197EAD3C|nr:hypothetical protein [Burkholderia sp. Ac-20379]MBN3725133.1 hypothetical protein [Burkholderia sp. Ac-20379]
MLKIVSVSISMKGRAPDSPAANRGAQIYGRSGRAATNKSRFGIAKKPSCANRIAAMTPAYRRAIRTRRNAEKPPTLSSFRSLRSETGA